MVKWRIYLYYTSENANQGVNGLNGRFGVTYSVLLNYMALKFIPPPKKAYPVPFFVT